MGTVAIGMDPRKRSATIEVMAADETVLGGGRYGTDAAGYAAMLAGARQSPARIWTIEGCQGIGRHLAGRLVAAREQVVDVPPKLSARNRVFTAGQGRKTDATDAHSVALVATRMTGLHPVTGDAQLAVLRVLADRRKSLGEDHTRMICQLHQLLLDLIPGGARQGAVRGPGQGAAGPGPAARPGRAGPPPGRRRADQRPGTDPSAQEGRGQGADRGAEGHRHHADQPAGDRPVRRPPGCSSRPATSPGSPAGDILRRGTDRADRRVLR